jgi:catechol 2,3-dioxygenase-like lactoylglutathione lyase family enzyme
MKPLADRLDHVVLTVSDIEATTRFYERALGFEREFFRGPEGQPRHALRFGDLKINLQDRSTETPTKAKTPTFGAGDFCLLAAVALDEVIAQLRAENITIDTGPVARRGALGPIRSIYLRDPDGNLVEVAEYLSTKVRRPYMPVPIDVRYKQVFVQLRFASALSFKIFAGWGTVYAALTALFAWMQSSTMMSSFTWVVPLLGFGATILFWLGDVRNRPGISAAKSVGAAIEADAASEIPEAQRYFSRLNQGVRHGVTINAFAMVMLVLLGVATVRLIS